MWKCHVKCKSTKKHQRQKSKKEWIWKIILDNGKEKMNLKLKVNFGWLDKEKNLAIVNGFIWITLISGLIIYYQLIPDITSSMIAGIMIAGLTYLAIFGIKWKLEKDEIQKLIDEKKESENSRWSKLYD